MKLSSSCDICVRSLSLLSDDSLVRGEYVGVTCEIEEGGEGIFTWKCRGVCVRVCVCVCVCVL